MRNFLDFWPVIKVKGQYFPQIALNLRYLLSNQKIMTKHCDFLRKACCLIFIFGISSGSSFISAQQLSIGGGLGLTTYWGDLNSGQITSDFYHNSGLSGQLLATYQPSRFYSLRANLIFGKIMGNDALSDKQWQKERNLSFQSNLTDFSFRLMVHPWSFGNRRGSFAVSPYASMGLTIFHFDPTTEYNGMIYRLQPLGTEGQGIPGFQEKYRLTQFAVPVGGGIKIELSPRVDILLEAYATKTFTDYLDDVGAHYVNYYTILDANGLLAAQLSDRTPEALGLSEPMNRTTGSQKGGKFGDYYLLTHISFVYKLSSGDKVFSGLKGSGVVCPQKSKIRH